MEQNQPTCPLWQRVTAPAAPSTEDLQQLILWTEEAAGDYGYLMTHARGLNLPAKKLYEGTLDTLAALRGIQLLRKAPSHRSRPMAGSQQTLRRTLERCYYRARKLTAEFTARSAEMDFGVVFARLAHREQTACAILAAMLGTLGS